ncbi:MULTISPECIES: sugar ABC transporter ATP-binding protein [unclassified Leucobacter]|uniref:sugar ABC transporter ATP-binding protein n=1 Tax=unclassified Leucobacter TaxID=2621730 RepID=UPI00165E8A32|nr:MULTISPECIES: sugar ABC transporter ATP-binding protein [unclassified Leucobacter]MBC9936995.1 sugar ABC transporter ATP-binding protein [Leucobacter sp. cx-87]
MKTQHAHEPMLELRGVAKAFGQVIALRDGSLTLHPGSIHALVGENGAGKSTVVKIIAGLYRRDGGEIRLAGEVVDFATTAEAKDAGIAVIYQEPTLFPDLSVTENIFMGRQPLGRFRRIDRGRMRTEVEQLFARLGVSMDPERTADGLSIADQQMIEIAKAISLDARVLIMDEPTAALSGIEVERLFQVARALRDEGRALVFISHRFDEVFALCDTITVMRDGSYVSTTAIADTDPDTVVAEMVGREITELFPKTVAEIGAPVLEVSGLTSPGVFTDISFTVHAGEIVGLAGLVGAGRSEVARAIFGVDGYRSGSVRVAGEVVPKKQPTAAMRAGLALVPEDRRKQGLVLDESVARNTASAVLGSISKLGLVTNGAEMRAARPWSEKLEVKANAMTTLTGTLSGGNQQKVVLGKWLATDPRVLIIDEPTRGIDVGTKSEVHRLLSALAGQGLAILMISSELPEVLGMADRVVVMREGHITATIDRSNATQENVMRAATQGANDEMEPSA